MLFCDHDANSFMNNLRRVGQSIPAGPVEAGFPVTKQSRSASMLCVPPYHLVTQDHSPPA